MRPTERTEREKYFSSLYMVVGGFYIPLLSFSAKCRGIRGEYTELKYLLIAMCDVAYDISLTICIKLGRIIFYSSERKHMSELIDDVLEAMAVKIETRLGLVFSAQEEMPGKFDPDRFCLMMIAEIEEPRGGVVDESGDLSILYATRVEQLLPEDRRAIERKLLWQIDEMGRSNDPSTKKLYSLVAGINRQFTEE